MYVMSLFFFKQKPAYEMRISDWSSDVCSSDLHHPAAPQDFHVEARLAEQNFGRWQGRSYEALAAEDSEAWRHFWLAPAAEVPPGGESFATLSGRVAAAIETLTRQHAGRDIVCIGHGGTIRAALAHALAVPPEQALSFAIDTCSLTRLDHFADDAQSTRPEERLSGSWRITVVNACAQLPA